MIDTITSAWGWELGRWPAMLLIATGLLGSGTEPAFAWQDQEQGDESDDQGEPANDELSPEELDQQDVLSDSIYVDPAATAAMRGSYDQLFANALIPPNTDRTIVQMARGTGRLDSGLIDQYIKASARQLTNRDNIAAVQSVGSPQARVQAIQDAGRNLMAPYLVPVGERDRRFFQEFNRRLLAVAPDLLRNHLYARVQVMQSLSRMGDLEALDLLIAQMVDPEQPLIVKQLSAEGLRRIAIETGDTLSTADREKAADALVAFLNDNQDAYWLCQARALQALGTIRQIYRVQNREQAIFADEVMAILSSRDLRPESRAWAAWALGMLEVPPAYPQLNFSLAAHEIGLLAVEIGERIVELSDPRDLSSYNPERVKYLTGLIASPIYSSFDGSSELSGASGLRNVRGLGPHQQDVTRISQIVRQLAIASVELTRARGSLISTTRDRVIASLNELRTFLSENEPEERSFIPGGRQFVLQDGS